MNNLDSTPRLHDYSPQAPLTEPPNSQMVGKQEVSNSQEKWIIYLFKSRSVLYPKNCKQE
jgi:hypothetical protein